MRDRRIFPTRCEIVTLLLLSWTAISVPVLAQGGSIVAWGDNTAGQTNVPPTATNVVAIASGYLFNLALRADGHVVAWGLSDFGQTNVPASATNVVAVSASVSQALALRADGSVVGWGGSSYGGNGVPLSATNVIAIAAGAYHGVALRADNSLVTWGQNTYGQRDVPPSATNVVAIAGGRIHSLALRKDGTVVTWGGNNGAGNVPASATNIVAIGAGDQFSAALRADGNVIVWGGVYPEIRNVPADATNVISIAVGYDHILALRGDGNIVIWGDTGTFPTSITNVAANLSALSAGGEQNNLALRGVSGPVIVRQPSSQTNYINGTPVFSVTAYGTLPLTYQWRRNGTNLTQTDRLSSVIAPTFLINPLTTDDAGGYSVIISNGFGAVTSSIASLTVIGEAPSFIAGPTNQTVDAGDNLTFAVTVAGDPPPVYQWQLNGTNLNGKTNGSLTITNAQAANVGDYRVIAANIVNSSTSSVASLVVQSSGPVILTPPLTHAAAVGLRTVFTTVAKGTSPLSYRWQVNGTNIPFATSSTLAVGVFWNSGGTYRVFVSNALGVASAEADLTVAPIAGWGTNANYAGQTEVPFGATNAIAIAVGYTNLSAPSGPPGISAYDLALVADGSVVAWGNNTYGQTNVPASATNVVGIAAGGGHCLALRADGSIVGWGNNASGQGNPPANATNVVMIAAGLSNSLALRLDGSVVAWGDNTYGQCSVPSSVTNIVSIAAGGFHCLALRANGSVVGWGYNVVGQTNVPAAAANVVGIAAGGFHSLALRSNGTVVAWGFNGNGQINVPATATNVVALAAGRSHSVALRADGSIVTWGNTLFGLSSNPTAGTNAVAIAAGGDHNLALVIPKTFSSLSYPQWNPNGVAIIVPTVRSGRYVLERANTLSGTPWTARQRAAGDGTPRELIEPTSDFDQGFYRAWQLP